MPRKVITLGIADDMLLDQTLIDCQIKILKGTSVLFRCGNGNDLLFKLQHFKPDILILDLYMPFMNGWEVLHELKSLHYTGYIICTANVYEPNLKNRLIDLGANGFVHKQNEQLAVAITEVIIGNTYFETPYFVPKQHLQNREEVELSGREIRIINKLAEGKASKAIADELGGLSSNSVDTYIKNLLLSFRCNNRAQLVSLAHAYGLIYTFETVQEHPRPKPKEHVFAEKGSFY